MKRISVSADSVCDLSPELIEQNDIGIAPLYVVCDNGEYKDGVEISPLDVIRLVDHENKNCSTAAVSCFDYEELFKNRLDNAEYLFHVCISSEMSTCYQNACNVAKEFDGRVFVIDSRNLSSAVGHVVLEIVKMAEQGVPVEEIYSRAVDLTGRVEASFVVDTMDYLKRGGRCSALKAFGATVLKIKPCIEVIDGKMTVATTYKGSIEKCLKKYVRDRLEGRDDIITERIFVTYSPTEDAAIEALADTVRDMIKEYADFNDIIKTQASCTITSHCGPGTLGILFIRK